MRSGEQRENSSAALRYCQKRYEWLVKISRSALRKRNFPNYMDEGEDVAQTVCEKCALLRDELWATANSREAFIRKRVWWETNRLLHERAARPSVTLEESAIPADRPHRNTLIAALTIKQALARMPPEKAAIIRASKLEGLTDSEIAELMHITPAAVRKRLSRAYRDLKKILRAGNAGPPFPVRR